MRLANVILINFIMFHTLRCLGISIDSIVTCCIVPKLSLDYKLYATDKGNEKLDVQQTNYWIIFLAALHILSIAILYFFEVLVE
jgi:hypothetical protein